jgi:hypothetical protein
MNFENEVSTHWFRVVLYPVVVSQENNIFLQDESWVPRKSLRDACGSFVGRNQLALVAGIVIYGPPTRPET